MKFPFDKEIVLQNKTVLLRPLTMDDKPNLLPIALQDKTLLQYSPTQIYSDEMLDNYISKALAERLSKNRYPFIIFDKQENKYAGSTSFLNISDTDSRIEIGATWIGRDFQKTGLNRNCKYLLMSYVFEELGAERLEFKTDERNTASRKAIEGIGGKFEGIMRSHTLMYDGFRRNTACYSILKSEWPHFKQTMLNYEKAKN